MRLLLLTVFFALFSSVGYGAWNDPYPNQPPSGDTLYSSFSERPKHLDPARAYSHDEYVFIAQIYEPPLQYHFLKRPYVLEPLAAETMPEVRYLAEDGTRLEDRHSDEVAFTDYVFSIKPGSRFAPHPAFARDEEGNLLYHDLADEALASVRRLSDFPIHGTRELVAADYVHQVKRLVHPGLHSPIAGLMRRYILGLDELAERVAALHSEAPGRFIDLRPLDLTGVRALDRYRYRIRIKGRYPQFIYWQAMPFFAPMPWEAERFYHQPKLQLRNITLDWYPVGTGPFMLAENNPNLRMVLVRNPNFAGELYPSDAGPAGVPSTLTDAGRPMPFIHRAVYSLEKEAIPRWSKFVQGYYDDTGALSSDSFDQAVVLDGGAPRVSPALAERNIRLDVSVAPTVFYMGFNMMDPVVGGTSTRARKLRHAISIAVDFDEYVAIFRNGRGVAAQGPLPPGIFGHREGREGLNPVVYEWRDGAPRRRSIDEAKGLMEEAGYPGGRDPDTGRPLALYFEAITRGADAKARLDWLRKQYAKIGIDLVVRATDYNRFREKMLKGKAQIYMWGWNADYPDPENFFFLLYGPDAKAVTGGENTSNYRNPRFDALFEQMRELPNGAPRQLVIDELVELVRYDAPWLWGFFPQNFKLTHGWYHNATPNLMANNTLKYVRLEPELRAQWREAWNQPVLWPLAVLGVGFALFAIPVLRLYRKRESASAISVSAPQASPVGEGSHG